MCSAQQVRSRRSRREWPVVNPILNPSSGELSLEQVYGAIAFYLAHQQEVEANIREGEEEIQRSVPPWSESHPELYARLECARHEVSTQDLAKH